MAMGALERLTPVRRLGDITLVARLGEGGMATVYLGAVGEGPTVRPAAVKLLRADLPDHQYRTRFLDEARLVVKLHHNNLVDVRAAGESENQLYIAMELVEGRDLADVWDRCAEIGRAFPVSLAVHIVREALRGLHYAHTRPGLALVHRDVSPSNILLDWAGAVRVADFGLATSAIKATHTMPGVVFGKVGYMSPEQALHEPLDGRTDVYACGVVLWELLTGRPLRSGDSMNTDAVARFTAPNPASLTRRVDPELDDIVMKALERDLSKRWASADDMREALSAWLVRNDPTVEQESVAKFLREIFGETGDREREQREALIRAALQSQPSSGPPAPAAQPPASSSDTKLFVRGLQPSGPPDKRSPGAHGMVGGPDTLVGSMAGRAAQPTPSTAMAAGQPPTIDELERIDPGTVIEERYRVLTMLGRGGMGTVYLGEHLTVGRQVAIKVLTHQWSADPAISKRFRAEARAASAAGHQHIIEVFDAGELDDGRLYLVMEFLTGRNLFEEVQATGPMKVARACRIMRQVARAIRAAHGVGVIHRDLKPDNVMLVDRDDAENDFVKVLDFGISSHGAAAEEEADRLTRPGLAIGTPEYMAPEQAMGREVTPSFDIYALGVIFYELLTGDPPILSENAVEILARKSGEDAPSIATKRDDLPDELVALIDECLSRNPEERPASADVFLKRLEAVLRALPREMSEGTKMALAASQAQAQAHAVRQALEVVSTEEETKRGRSLMWAFGGVAAALIGIGGAVAFAVSSSKKAERERTETAIAQPQGDGQSAGVDVDAETTEAEVDPLESDSDPQTGGDQPTESDDAGLPSQDTDEPAANGTTGPKEPTTGGESDSADTGEELPAVAPDETGGEPKPESVPKHKTAECTKSRQSAKQAQNKRDWDGMLEHTQDKKCWARRSDVVKLRVKALSEKGNWSRCVKEGSGSSDASVKKLVNLCEAQLSK